MPTGNNELLDHPPSEGRAAAGPSHVRPLLAGLDALGEGLAVWSSAGRLVYRNASCQSIFSECDVDLAEGLSIEALLRALAESGLLLVPDDEGAWIRQELSLFQSGGASEFAFLNGCVYRIERWRLPDGGAAMLVLDVTEEKRNERALRAARNEADRSDRTKSRFLRAANHDLRQPLATLKILIYNCMTTDDEEHRRDLLHAMDISVSIMEDLLGALLNIGQLDAGQIKPRITTFQLSALLERLGVEFGHQAREKGLKFRVVPTRYAVVSDRALLERVVSNLVANAIRYTERGGILMGCRRAGDKIRLEVRDSGVGISAEHLDAIFDEFYQVARSSGHRRGGAGLGLGLNIAKRIADILNHRLEARSEPGRGSIFSVVLPVGDILQSDIGEPEINERVGGEFTGLSVLFLEDDDTLRDALTELLERWGIVVKAFNAFDDIAAYLDESGFRPSLIITDYRLRGGLKGTEMVAKIRSQLESNAPAIVVTADTDPGLIRGIRSEGFPVLIKPVSPPGLRVMMHNILYEPELVRELAHHEP
jgi:signal transduction histidine kinase/CheY-like chemotaxis protein